MFNKKIEKICGNCKLYNPKNKSCSIVILFEGERKNLPVDPEDYCFYEDMDNEYGFIEDVKEVKFWVENESGEKTDGDGVVKIEYPEDGFFNKKHILEQ